MINNKLSFLSNLLFETQEKDNVPFVTACPFITLSCILPLRHTNAQSTYSSGQYTMYISYLHCQHIQVGTILCTSHTCTVNIFKWAVYYVHLIFTLSTYSSGQYTMYISYLHCKHIQVGSILCTSHTCTVNIFKWAVYYVHFIFTL